MTDLCEFHLFPKLLPELRILIWEATLPDQRLFHVRGLESLGYSSPWISRLKFHIRYPRPISLSVCQESRRATQRRGFFLGAKVQHDEHSGGVWFNPEKDVLYIDRNQRTVMKLEQSERRKIADLDRILHVGLEWRAIMIDTSILNKGEDMRRLWRNVIQSILLQMPNVKSIHYVLPMIRHKGYQAWAREPHGASKYHGKLCDLPLEISIPWGNVSGDKKPHAAGPGLEADTYKTTSGRTGYHMPWEKVKQGMMMAMEAEGNEWDQFDLNKDRRLDRRKRPEVFGSWLLRRDAIFRDDPSTITQAVEVQ